MRVSLPIACRNIESFHRNGARTVIGLEGNSSIDLDWKNNRYTVVANGVEIAKDGDTFCPIGDDRIAFYSKTGKRLTATLPKGWNAAGLKAKVLFADRSEEVPVNVHGNKVSLDVQPEQPVIVFRNVGRPIVAAAGLPAGRTRWESESAG